MIKKELKNNLKSFIIWLLILVIMFGVVYLIYPYMFTNDTKESIDQMMEIFPPEVLKSFNMDLASMDTAYGWFKTEGFTFVLLIIGIYASFLGGNILLKEENDKTIEYLGFLPIKRSRIITNKLIVSIIYIIGIVLLLLGFNYIGLILSGDLNQKEFLLLSLTPLFIALPLFGINLFISTFLHKNKKTIGISLGIVFISYILSILSELSTNVEFIKYFSIYTLADVRNVISNVEINPIMVIISLSITIIMIILTYIRYDKKELI